VHCVEPGPDAESSHEAQNEIQSKMQIPDQTQMVRGKDMTSTKSCLRKREEEKRVMKTHAGKTLKLANAAAARLARRKTLLALCVVFCTLGLGLSANAQRGRATIVWNPGGQNGNS
jgi:hypothetical protein